MSTLLPVPVSHTVAGHTKGIDRSGPYVRVRSKLASYADVDNFCNVAMGFGKATGAAGSVTVTRSTPHQYAQSPNLFAVSADLVEGLGAPVLSPGGFPSYSGGAIVAVEYRPGSFDFAGTGPYNAFDATTAGTSWCT
jgi:hypothetical protein